MARYTWRTYEERKRIQEFWEGGASAKEIAAALKIPLRSLYAELRRGQDGTRQTDQRLRYDADLAQLHFRQAIERRGNRGTRHTPGTA